MHCFLNGRFLSAQEATLSVLDLGLIRGFSVFDYLRTYNEKPFHIEEHLQRLQYSAHNLGLSLPYTFTEIEEIIETLMKKSGSGEKSIKLFLTGGISADQLLPSENTSFIVLAYPLTSPAKQYYTDGIKTITNGHKRCLPDCKTTQYLSAIVSLQKGKKKGALESLYLSDQNTILEGATSNFFAIKQGILLTPPEDEILVGVTREVVLRLCKGIMPIKIRPISLDEISEVDEAFITASNKEIMPVTQIDDILIGDGRVGPLTQKIMSLFADYTSKGRWEPLTIPRYTTACLAE